MVQTIGASWTRFEVSKSMSGQIDCRDHKIRVADFRGTRAEDKSMVSHDFRSQRTAALGITPVYTLYCTGVLRTCTSVYTWHDTPYVTH
jgi:hypothetical protein